jgi:hypothetical protein
MNPGYVVTSRLSAFDAAADGAGEGNRTLIASLEGWNSTIELHPLKNQMLTDYHALLKADNPTSARRRMTYQP